MKWENLHKIGISGSRKFPHLDLVTQYLDQQIRYTFNQDTEQVVLITGGAVGVDSAVELYCMRRGIKNLIIHARWLELERPYGKNPAGVIRNKHIVQLADEVIAFWDGESPGTKHCIEYAKEKFKTITVFSPQGLRDMMHVPTPHPTTITIPTGTKTRDNHRIRELVQDAKIPDLLKKAKKVFKWQKA